MSHPYLSRPIRVIHLKGDSYAVGRNHGQAFTEEARGGMVGFYSSFWKRMLDQPNHSMARKAAHALVAKIIDPFLVQKLAGQLPQSVRDMMRGLSHGTQIPESELVRSVILPDLMPILLSLSVQLRAASVIPVVEPVVFGCSSFFTTTGNSLLHGRNLDFPGVGYWDRYPVIQMVQPPRGLKYIGFTTAGVPIAGITGVNEAQVSVSLHQHYCRRYCFNGVPPFVIAERVLTEAKNLKEALGILRQMPVSAAWAFLIGDGKTKEAMLYECHPKAFGVMSLNETDGCLAHSNYFQTATCQQEGYATSDRMNWDNYWRKTRLEHNVRLGNLTAELACQYLSEPFDGYWQEEKIVNRTVSQAYNIQSVVLDLSAMQAWVAEGDCPVHMRSYSQFDLGEVFNGREGRTGRAVPAYRFTNSAVGIAKQHYILSFVASFDGDDELALVRVEQSLKAHFSAESAMVAGVLCLKRGDYSKAQSYFERGAEFIEQKAGVLSKRMPPEYFETLLFLGRCHDLQGNRSKGQRYYGAVVNNRECTDEHLRRLAKRGRHYSAKDLARVLTPYSTYIPFE